MLGYKCSKTTEIYTHASKRNIATIRSPLAGIMVVGKSEGRESDRVELVNLRSDVLPSGTEFRTRVWR